MENTSVKKKEKSRQQPLKHICMGILAHVDAGKTTLAESILYLTGSIKKPGRVDHQDAFLDTDSLERERGITIFSKQAVFEMGDWAVTLLDTPGHVDFSTEMERTLQVLDYAILVISGADGVQGHVQTLWKLLDSYHIPVFLFVNKMDQPGIHREQLLDQLCARLSDHCVDAGPKQPASVFMENMAVCDEALLEAYLENGTLETAAIRRAIAERKIFPVYFGSALKMTGVRELLEGISCYMEEPVRQETFGARVFKISRDEKGNRLTHLKITGGCLKVKQVIGGQNHGNETEEKVDQIRIYSGAQFRPVSEAWSGMICAVTGLTQTGAGQGLGIETMADQPILSPVLNYALILPDGCNVHELFLRLKQLEEEDPQLHIVWNDRTGEIHAQVMGEVQIEILKSLIAQRFGVDVDFGSGSIVYKETITEPVEGVGHFEPLRHYAEVHLLLEPLPVGSGLVFETNCSEDVLDKNWQRLVRTHLEEKRHVGVLTGSEITDMRITLVAGRAHPKHTEGGDFRQATYRAVRQGLRSTQNRLLEPWYDFRLEIPSPNVGRALADIQKMYGEFNPPEPEGELTLVTGRAPVATMRDYQMAVVAYTKGYGRLSCSLSGYAPCHNASEIIERIGYDPENDFENPTGSVFCAHGAGFAVPWDKVRDYMHVATGAWGKKPEAIDEKNRSQAFPKTVDTLGFADEDELEEIFTRTYGPIKRDRNKFNRTSGHTGGPGAKTQPGGKEKDRDNSKGHGKNNSRANAALPGKQKEVPEKKEYLLVDGYNIIFAWDDLKALASVNIDSARTKLMDLLCDYQGYRRIPLILVFDAYKVEGYPGEIQQYKNIYVVYTKEAETADQYIEKTVHEIGRKHHVTVATSDALEQVIILGQGARRISARGLLEEIEEAREEMRKNYLNRHKKHGSGQYLMENMPEDMARLMEDVRLGKCTMDDKNQ